MYGMHLGGTNYRSYTFCIHHRIKLSMQPYENCKYPIPIHHIGYHISYMVYTSYVQMVQNGPGLGWGLLELGLVGWGLVRLGGVGWGGVRWGGVCGGGVGRASCLMSPMVYIWTLTIGPTYI